MIPVFSSSSYDRISDYEGDFSTKLVIEISPFQDEIPGLKKIKDILQCFKIYYP